MPISRSVRTYRPAAALVGALTGITAILGVLASPGGASPKTEPLAPVDIQKLGMNSCSARGCHGAVASVDPSAGDVYIKGGAYTTWLNFDPHSKAYDVLKQDRSQRIAKNLNKVINGKQALGGKEAHQAELCLSCHSTIDTPPAALPSETVLKDGVTCEACHGPASDWQEKHLDVSWMTRTRKDWKAGAKEVAGMTNLSTPRGRAENCVRCHVGDRTDGKGMDMNHDLIAAGHPRLNFEFGSYLASYPKHWKERAEDSSDFEAKSWAIGQLVTAKATLQLLIDRAGASKAGGKKESRPPKRSGPSSPSTSALLAIMD